MESKQGNKIAGPSIPLRLEFVTFLSCVGVAAGKLGRASANKHRRGPSTPRHKTLCYAIDLRGASLRMTPFSRRLKNMVGCKNAKGSKKSQALGMTIHIWVRGASAQERLPS